MKKEFNGRQGDHPSQADLLKVLWITPIHLMDGWWSLHGESWIHH